MTNPWAWWDADTIARITKSPIENVKTSWPLIADALDRRGIYTRNVARGVLATVAIETASSFLPIDEFEDWVRYPGTGGYPPHYGGGPTFHGRGFVQLTHDYNYRAASQVVGVDLVGNPALANDPKLAAEIMAWYWATKTIPSKDGSRTYSLVELCEEADWEWVRRAVQGGTNGLDRLITIAITTALGGAAVPDKVSYNPLTPAIAQDDGWSCAPTSLRWALTSLGRNPGPLYIENLLVRDGVVSKEQGLLDASGAQLAAWIGKTGPEYYGSDGLYGNSEPSITFDGAMLEGDHAYPLLIGGRAWGHWSGLAGYDPARDVLLLANPGEGWMGVGQTMSRQQFASLGPFSMVRVLHPDLLEVFTEPPPIPPVKPPVPPDTRIPRAREHLVAALAILDEPYPPA
jgi:hypothetical protein